jgi:hypothetical protein
MNRILLAAALFAAMISHAFGQAAQMPANTVKCNPVGSQAQEQNCSYPFIVLGPSNGADDRPTVNAALTAMRSVNGTVYLGKYRYLINSANIVVPSGVTLACSTPWAGGKDANGTWNYASRPCSLVLNPSYTVSLSARSKMDGITVISSSITTQPATVQAALMMVAGFGGTGITVNGMDALIERTLILGFTTCLYSSGWERLQTRTVYGDCTNGMVLDNSHDIARINDTEWYPFLTTNIATTTTSQSIRGAADNGSGIYRITVSSTAAFSTGNTVWTTQIGGAQGANGKFTATVVDSTHIDLQGAKYAPSTTGNTTSRSTYVTVASTANLAIGQTVSGTGIPGGATVAAVWRTASAITLSAAATATSSGVTLSFANGAYTSGGTLWIDTNQRSGTGFTFTNGEGNICEHCFAIGYNTGFHLGIGSLWTRLIASDVDQNISLTDPTSIAFLIDGTANANTIADGVTSSIGRSLVVNTTGTGPQIISNIHLNVWAVGSNGGNAIELDNGRIDVINSETILSGQILVASTLGWSTVGSGNWFPSLKIYFASSTAQNNFHIDDWNNFANWHKNGIRLTSCGTGSLLNGNSSDFVGSIVEGSGASGCTINFATEFGAAPICIVTYSSGGSPAYTSTQTALIIKSASASGIYYNCGGRSNIQ